MLLALCRPLLDRDMFTEPASTRSIADELVITQAAVKQHLANLYDKFGVPSSDSNRRARLANEALRRGAVSLSQLRRSREPVGLRYALGCQAERHGTIIHPSARYFHSRGAGAYLPAGKAILSCR